MRRHCSGAPGLHRCHSMVVTRSVLQPWLCTRRLMEEVKAARNEADDNARFLAPLRKPLDRFCSSGSLDALPGSFQARCVLCMHSQGHQSGGE